MEESFDGEREGICGSYEICRGEDLLSICGIIGEGRRGEVLGGNAGIASEPHLALSEGPELWKERFMHELGSSLQTSKFKVHHYYHSSSYGLMNHSVEQCKMLLDPLENCRCINLSPVSKPYP